jgi:hypothetical protein
VVVAQQFGGSGLLEEVVVLSTVSLLVVSMHKCQKNQEEDEDGTGASKVQSVTCKGVRRLGGDDFWSHRVTYQWGSSEHLAKSNEKSQGHA